MDTERHGIQHPVVWVIVVAVTLLLLFLFCHVAWLAIPFVLAVVLYYVCSSAVDWLKKIGFSHTQAVYSFLVTVTLLIMISLPVGIRLAAMAGSIPQNASKAFDVTQMYLMKTAKSANDFIHADSGQPKETFSEEIDLEKVMNERLSQIKKDFVVKKLPTLVVDLLSWLPSLFLVPYITFFFLRDSSKFKKLLMRGVPNAFFEKILLLFHKIDLQVKQYFRGLAMLTILNAATIGCGLWLVGLGSNVFDFFTAIGMGVFCAILAWVPYVGAVIGCGTVVAVSITSAPGNYTLLMASVSLFIIAKILEDFVYTPLTVGHSLRMHPMLTVLMIFIGGYVGGMIGLLLAIPMLGVIMVFGEIIDEVLIDDRLRARYWYALRLKREHARKDLAR